MKLFIFIGILASFVSVTYAAESESTTTKEDAAKLNAAMKKVVMIPIDCEYDSMCMLKRAEELHRTDPNPVSTAFYTQLKANEKQIEYSQQNCSLDEIKATKKILAVCTKESIDKVFNGTEVDANKELLQCTALKLEPGENGGNIFAQGMMATISDKKGDPASKEKWQNEVEMHKGKPEYEVFQKCKSEVQ